MSRRLAACAGPRPGRARRILLALIGLVVVVTGALATARAQDVPNAGDTPTEGRVYRNFIRLEGRYWPLPQGEWTVLAYIPRASAFGGGYLFRVGLAQFTAEHKIKALVLLSAGTVAATSKRTASTETQCGEPPVAFRGEREIVDAATNYSCWRLLVASTSKLADNDFNKALVAKLRQVDPDATEFDSVAFIRRQDARVGTFSLWIPPTQLLPPGAGDLTLDANARPGTSLAVAVVLREWAIRWQPLLRTGFEGKLTAQDASVPLPQLKNAARDLAMLPDLGLRAGASFEHTVPIGPFVLPLPKGIWKVALRLPQVSAAGNVVADQVTLVNIENGKLDGVIKLLSLPLNPKTGGRDELCKNPIAQVVEHGGSDEFCASINWLHIAADDAKWPLVQDLKGDGVEMPSGMVGSAFVFSNQLLSIRTLYAFSPAHVGLPDVTIENQGKVPPEWMPLIAKWRRWTADWAEVVEAGMTGRLDPGPLPPKWRAIDLRGELSIDGPVPKIDQQFTGSVALGGRDWPLPSGSWTVVSVSPQMRGEDIDADEIWLAQIAKTATTSALDGIVIITISRPDIAPPVQTAVGNCKLAPSFVHRIDVDPGVRQDCWVIGTMNTAKTDMHGFDAFHAAVRARGLPMPDAWIGTRFTMLDRNRSALVSYLFPVTSVARAQTDLRDGSATPGSAEPGKPGGGDPAHIPVFMALRQWTEAMHPRVRAAFDRDAPAAAQFSKPLERPRVQH